MKKIMLLMFGSLLITNLACADIVETSSSSSALYNTSNPTNTSSNYESGGFDVSTPYEVSIPSTDSSAIGSSLADSSMIDISSTNSSPGIITSSAVDSCLFDHHLFMLPNKTGTNAVVQLGGNAEAAKANPGLFTFYVDESATVTKHKFENHVLTFAYENGDANVYQTQIAYTQQIYDFSKNYSVSYKLKSNVSTTVLVTGQKPFDLIAGVEKKIEYTAKAGEIQFYIALGGAPGEYVFSEFYMEQLPDDVYIPKAPSEGGEYFYAPSGANSVIEGYAGDTYNPSSNRGKFVFWQAKYLDWTEGICTTAVTANFVESSGVLNYSFTANGSTTGNGVTSGHWAAQLFYSSPATINYNRYKLRLTIEAAQDATIIVCGVEVPLIKDTPKAVEVDASMSNGDDGTMNANVSIQFGHMPGGYPNGAIFPGSYKLYNWSLKTR